MALSMLAPDTELHLLHVLDPRDVIDDPEVPLVQTELAVLEHAPGIMRERVRELARLRGLSLEHGKISSHTRIGQTVDTLLQMTVDYDADLLIVGCQGLRGLDRLILGSVAEKLVQRAHCPVLVARNKDYAGLPRTERPAPAYAPNERHGTQPTETGAFIASTELDGWRPSHAAPTGFRIV